MARLAVPKPTDQQHWKEVFEGSLIRLNGGSIPASKQPIFTRPKPTTFGIDSSKDAIAAAATSLAALWQISGPNRLHRSE
ncbi:MAG: hypothetical protein ABR874_05485 [Candidatus Sulfotelmatobacter sp.]|jgi:hypothetical protein